MVVFFLKDPKASGNLPSVDKYWFILVLRKAAGTSPPVVQLTASHSSLMDPPADCSEHKETLYVAKKQELLL